MNGIHDDVTVPAPEHQSIFTDTYDGVPSPTIPHTHPYPTRFHGPIYTTPRFYFPYQHQAWQAPIQSPLLKPHPKPGCNTCGQGVTTFTDPVSGLGSPALLGSPTGSVLLDIAIGAGAGYFMATRPTERVQWAVAGGAAGLLAGTLGIIGVIGAGFYLRKGG